MLPSEGLYRVLSMRTIASPNAWMLSSPILLPSRVLRLGFR